MRSARLRKAFAAAWLAGLLLAAGPAGRAQEAAPSVASLEVQTGGHGEPELIFLPDLGGAGKAWEHVVARFEAGYRCHVVVPAGFGGGRAGVQTGRFLDETARAVVAYVREQGLRRPVLVGQGLGGVLALEVALQDPNLPGRLVLVDSLPFPAGGKRGTDEDAAPSGQAREVADEAARSDPATLRQAAAELLATDLRAALRRVRCPTLVLGALAGPGAAPRQVYRRQYRGLPGVRFAFFGAARPPLMVDNLDGFTDALRRELTPR